MKFGQIVLCLILISLCLPAHSAEDTSSAPAATILWKVSSSDNPKPSYVFAKWHLLCRNEIIFLHKVKLAIHESERLLVHNYMGYVTDLDYFERQKILQDMPHGIPIYKTDGRKKRKKLLKLIKQHLDLNYDPVKGIKYLVKRMTPFDTFLHSSHSFIKDCHAIGSFDKLLVSHFRKQEHQIGGFSTLEAFFQSWLDSGAMDAEQLIARLQNMPAQQALVNQMKFAYYRDQDLTSLNQLYLEFLENGQNGHTEKYRQHLLQADTMNWAIQIAQSIREKPTFISVNAAFVPGEKGLLAQLRFLGFTVEPVL